MKVRVFQLARDLKLSSDALVGIITSLGAEVKGHMSAIDEDLVERVKAKIAEERQLTRRETEKKAHIQEEIHRKAEEARPAPPPPAATPAPPAARPPVTPPVTPPPYRSPSPGPSPSGPSVPRVRPRPQVPYTPAPATGGPPRPGGPAIVPLDRRPLDIGRGRGKDTKRKGKKRAVDEKAVKESVRQTLAGMSQGRRRTTHRRRRGEDGGEAAETNQLKIHEFATVGELASTMEVKPAEVITTCISLGILANINTRLDKDAISAIMDEFGFEPEFTVEFGVEILTRQAEEEAGQDYESQPRSAVVTVMGHVDHGKTSLLDHIRKTRVIDTESGGITQHIGAYRVRLPQGEIAFLDTPGHEAFTAMRARGAQVTDLVVLVVAADDRVMPQTLEAINHAKAAGVPIIVAINKIDLPAANPDRIRKELADHGLLVGAWGGQTVEVEISAKHGTNVDRLLEMILLQAELLELKAEPDRKARGVVLESKRDTGRGVVATVLIQNGTLQVGDPFVCGGQFGKVRAMFNEKREKLQKAGPSTPVEVLGWSGVPQAGDAFNVTKNEVEAREIATKRSAIQREHEHRLARQAVSLMSIQDRIKKGELHELNLVVKADVGGSVEVLRDTLTKLSTSEVKVRIIHEGVGLINESDILLAVASHAIVIGFHTRPDAKAHQLALNEQIDVRLYRVIYEIAKDIKDAMSGLLAPERVEKIQGSAEIRRVFHINKVGNVAGCFVVSGAIHRGDRVRIYRGADIVWDGRLATLKRIKDDVREVVSGYECGMSFDGFDDIKEGDVAEAYQVEEGARHID